MPKPPKWDNRLGDDRPTRVRSVMLPTNSPPTSAATLATVAIAPKPAPAFGPPRSPAAMRALDADPAHRLDRSTSGCSALRDSGGRHAQGLATAGRCAVGNGACVREEVLRRRYGRGL